MNHSQIIRVSWAAPCYGIKIAVENHCDATVEELRSLMDRVGSETIGMCLDLGNFMIHGEDPVEATRALAPFLFSTHFKDYAVRMENYGFKTFGVTLGDGVIDLEATLKILREETHLDRLILEIPVEAEPEEAATLLKEDSYVRSSIQYAREVLGI